jgi:hypothetical protein
MPHHQLGYRYYDQLGAKEVEGSDDYRVRTSWLCGNRTKPCGRCQKDPDASVAGVADMEFVAFATPPDLALAGHAAMTFEAASDCTFACDCPCAGMLPETMYVTFAEDLSYMGTLSMTWDGTKWVGHYVGFGNTYIWFFCDADGFSMQLTGSLTAAVGFSPEYSCDPFDWSDLLDAGGGGTGHAYVTT